MFTQTILLYDKVFSGVTVNHCGSSLTACLASLVKDKIFNEYR